MSCAKYRADSPSNAASSAALIASTSSLWVCSCTNSRVFSGPRRCTFNWLVECEGGMRNGGISLGMAVWCERPPGMPSLLSVAIGMTHPLKFHGHGMYLVVGRSLALNTGYRNCMLVYSSPTLSIRLHPPRTAMVCRTYESNISDPHLSYRSLAMKAHI